MYEKLDYTVISDSDSYKMGHWGSYVPGMTGMYSYLESRGYDKELKVPFQNTVCFGLQGFLKQHLVGKHITRDFINQAEYIARNHFGNDKVFNKTGWERLLNKHDGNIPVRIKAVPEGSVVPLNNILVSVESTDEVDSNGLNDPWIVNYIETQLMRNWYPFTVATLSREMKRTLLAYAHLTGNPALVAFALHDFGGRSVCCTEQAAIGGSAHLVNFKGTDTLAGLIYAYNNYSAGICGFSIPATEHSTITSWKESREADAYGAFLESHPDGLIACVSDSYDIYKAIKEIWGGVHKHTVLARNGTLVIRPDSGDPVIMVPRLLNMMGEAFGYEHNAKGYKVLNPHVRLIWGDGINFVSVNAILHAMMVAGWSIDNVAFGMGGALLQKVNRDTLKFAFKVSSVTANGETYGVCKHPIDQPWKNSKAGRLKLVTMPDGKLKTVQENEAGEDMLQTVFENGKLVKEYTFDEVRENATIAYSDLPEIELQRQGR